MSPASLQTYLHEHIPLSLAMQARVVSIDPDELTLGAPLAPNINHRDTVFGGSASALAILSAWSLLHTRLHAEKIRCRLVIQRKNVEYGAPILGDFTASARLTDPADWAPFLRMFSRRGRARIAVSSTLESGGELVGHFQGEFVAMAPDASPLDPSHA
jgi:thioesterase domain-containing protein